MTRMLAAHDFEADEIQCRSQYQQDHAKRQAALAKDQTPAKPKEDADSEKSARDYCVQWRAAIAGERQGDIAKWATAVSFVALVAAFAAVAFARQAARGTLTANELNRANAVAAQRAWLSIDNFEIAYPTKLTEAGAVIRATFDVKNHGRTPALSGWIDAGHWLMNDSSVTYAQASEAFKSDVKRNVELGMPAPVVIFPNDVTRFSLTWTIGEDEMKRAMRERDGAKLADLTLFAGVAYRVVGDKAVHLTFVPFDWLNVTLQGVTVTASISLSPQAFLERETT